MFAFARAGYASYRYRRSLNNSMQESLLYAVFTMLAKFPESQGVLLYVRNRILGRVSTLIEYQSDIPKESK